MKKFLLTVLAVLGFASQAGSKTAITLDQITAPTTQAVMVSVPGKGWTQAQFDSSLILDTTTNPPTFKASAGGQPTFVDQVAPTGAVDGTNGVFILPTGSPNPGSSLQVFVNGIGNYQGVDYALNGTQITFSSGSVPGAGSSIRASYRK